MTRAQVRHGTSLSRIARCAAARRRLVLGFAAVAAIAGRAWAAGEDAGRPIVPPAAVAAPEPAAATDADAKRPIAAPSGSFTGDAVRTVVALGAVLALALVVRHVARKLVDPLAARRPSGVVQVLGRFPVAKGQSLLLISVGARVICAHQSAGRMETLCEFSDPQEIALLRTRIEAGTPARERFERELVRSLERDEGEPARTRALPAQRPEPIVTETVDLTKRRGPNGAAMRLVGVRA